MELAPDIGVGYEDFGDNDKPLQMWLSFNNVVSSTGELNLTDELVVRLIKY
jgi:hypothetical protein